MIALWAVLLTVAPIRVGSKQFTESVILGEVARQALEAAGVPAVHERELGGTRVLWEALRAGRIDAYPEYTGTIAEELLPGAGQGESLRAALAAAGVHLGVKFGFDDSYAIGMRREAALRLGIEKLSDLARHPELSFGLSNEFVQRKDGWPRLREVYGLAQARATGMEHAVAYRALVSSAIDATDLYSTDAEIRSGDLVALRDDLGAFPRYDAVLLWRAGLPADAAKALSSLTSVIDNRQMVELNARARIERVPEAQVAAGFLQKRFGIASAAVGDSRTIRILVRTREHLALVFVSLFASAIVGVLLGVIASRRRRLGQAVLAASSVMQIVPSLALLVLLVPLLGIGARPAIVALFLYGLLPIVRGTYAGLTGLAPELREAAAALGLPERARLWRVELPLATPIILAGIQTSAVINVGTATLGALVGAGGYGQPILAGVRLADTGLLLEGALPAAVLALLVQWAFELLSLVVVPRGLRARPRQSAQAP